MRLVEDLSLEQIEDGLGSVGAQLFCRRGWGGGDGRQGRLLMLTGACLEVASQHAVVLGLELGEQVRLNVLYLPYLDLRHRLVELCLDVAQRGRSTDLLVLLEHVLKVSSDPHFDIR